MTPHQFFPTTRLFCYSHLLEYIKYNVTDYYVREIASDSMWTLEACFDVFKGNKSFTVIFNRDVMSPSTVLNHLELSKVLDNLDEQYKLIKEVIYG